MQNIYPNKILCIYLEKSVKMWYNEKNYSHLEETQGYGKE